MNNLVEIIKDSLKLSEAVQFYTGQKIVRNKISCPFHSEKTASFTLFPNDTYYCFGCGESGDVIKFVQKLFNINFAQSVIRLNCDFGLSLPINVRMDKRALDEVRERHRLQELERQQHKTAVLENYWELFDEIFVMEKVIKHCYPKSFDEIPNPMFIYAINNLQYKKCLLGFMEDEARMLNE